VITEDEATRLLKRADPARVHDSAPFVDAAGYLAALRTRSTTVTLIDTEPTPTRPKHRRHWPIIAAAAAVVAIVVGGLVLATRDDDPNEQIPAATTIPADPDASAAEAEEIARGFLDAYAAYDFDRAMTYLADDAFPESFESPESLRLELVLFEAQPYTVTILDCEPQDQTAVGILVRCPFEFHFLRSDEIGVGPFGDNYWDLTVRDGRIVSSHEEVSFMTNGMNEMWTSFGNWVSAAYPEDAAVMFSDGISSAVHSEESAQLWAQHSRDFVQAVLTGPEAYVADVGAICATQAARLGELAVPAESDLAQVAAWNTGVAAILEQAHGELTALVKPPRADTTPYTRFYDRLIRLAGIVEESASAAAAGDSTRLAELDADYLEIHQAMSSASAGAGLEECLASLPS
jgi:hypothetical protein